MASYDVAIARTGFTSLSEAMAHRNVIGKLNQQVDLAQSVASDCREIDQVDVGKVSSELYKDLAAGKGHVIMLSQPEGAPVYGAELNYNPADGTTRSLVVEMGDNKLTQQGSTYKLEENGITTYFRKDEQRGVFTIMDGEADVPRIFGKADAAKLTAGTIQLNQPILMF